MSLIKPLMEDEGKWLWGLACCRLSSLRTVRLVAVISRKMTQSAVLSRLEKRCINMEHFIIFVRWDKLK